MPTNEYVVATAFHSELEKIAKKSSTAQDFAGGIDPFGTYTSSFGQRAEKAGISKKEHRKKRAVSAAGGLLGGAVLLPGAVMGTAAASKALSRGPSAALKAFRRGAVKPFKSLLGAGRAHKGLRRVKKTKGGGKLTRKETAALKRTVGKAPLKDIVEHTTRRGRQTKLETVARTKTEKVKAFIERVRKGGGTKKLYLRRKEAKLLDEPIRKELTSGMVQLSIGGMVGAAGADIQYRKGQQSEKRFKKRLKAAERRR